MKNVLTDKAKALSKLPLVELVGTDRVLIENHMGVLSYSLEEIEIKVTYGKFSVTGRDLKLMQMNREQMVIVGRIERIHLYRR